MGDLLSRVFQAVLHLLFGIYHLFDDEGLPPDTGKGAGMEAGLRLCCGVFSVSTDLDANIQTSFAPEMVHGGELT